MQNYAQAQSYAQTIQRKTIESEDSVKLLKIQQDYKLNFDPHISVLGRKAANQLKCPKEASSLHWF